MCRHPATVRSRGPCLASKRRSKKDRRFVSIDSQNAPRWGQPPCPSGLSFYTSHSITPIYFNSLRGI